MHLKLAARRKISAWAEEPTFVAPPDVDCVPELGPDALRDLLRACEIDLVGARARFEQATTQALHDKREISLLEKHAASLDAELQKLRYQAVSRDEELCDLRERLSHARLAEANALSDLSAHVTDRVELVRQLARLQPQAQSNRAALRAVGELQAAVHRLGDEHIQSRDQAACTIDELERDCARLRQELADATARPAAIVGAGSTRLSFKRFFAKTKDRP